ncbi:MULTISPECIES: fimbrial biogenesis chaperone [unclassified Pseudomonas]|uniref:fimbrial biogenesis chaperone n=1 Tax=unclassified Pseudomonas TaxID=196821 RepID=UPI000C86D487|nr:MULTISPECIES: molecular chaperone [unclassified Pseudomonas]PMV17983.1 hypothetical protein C1X17_28045 [Pseudomonas sp. FW305-3-2-15-C-TSA2]PMV18611.1 hypothetical protein C1X22_29460 [Pseudomonas sp. DP16D-L5]PMV33416.1 hypothetical protein C1X21_28970 [Pseudomonas sp. FW305-3-2-15-A-LB2]PMV37991.1 hypothetical protein C1X16_29645 [Pseudomonas sp. FW305-3-2-15-C-R2A1]PMV43566.1 hypothetical protein C1X18_28265 [Pseudomonas sp. FW305-3-2-15-C-LB1]
MKRLHLLFLSLFSASALAAGVPETRVIYHEDNGAFRQRVINNDTSQMLIKVWVDDHKEGSVPGVVVTPSVFIMKAESERLVKILNLKSKIIADREALYYLNVMALPPEEDRTGMSVITPIIARYKLLLRPAAMKQLLLEDAVQQLKWSIKNNNIEVDNPTPFHIVIAKLSINDKPVNIDHLNPKSTKVLDMKPHQKSAIIKWSYINDKGKNSEPIETHVK